MKGHHSLLGEQMSRRVLNALLTMVAAAAMLPVTTAAAAPTAATPCHSDPFTTAPSITLDYIKDLETGATIGEIELCGGGNSDYLATFAIMRLYEPLTEGLEANAFWDRWNPNLSHLSCADTRDGIVKPPLGYRCSTPSTWNRQEFQIQGRAVVYRVEADGTRIPVAAGFTDVVSNFPPV
jgi:hypothetical protein